jgi:hypothetical protein
MIVLVLLGMMSLSWMAAVAGVIFIEKVVPRGSLVTLAVAVMLVSLGFALLVSPRALRHLAKPVFARSVRRAMPRQGRPKKTEMQAAHLSFRDPVRFRIEIGREQRAPPTPAVLCSRPGSGGLS